LLLAVHDGGVPRRGLTVTVIDTLPPVAASPRRSMDEELDATHGSLQGSGRALPNGRNTTSSALATAI
jgi:hypothetical protein